VDRVIRASAVSIDLNVAERLSRAASRAADAADSELPTYDDSDRDLQVTEVRVTGFRGSAGSVTLDLTKQGRPVDVLLWGENGEGKSTLIDGLEFALQGRVDRSADFNSTLRAAVRNLSTPTAHVIVKLSDGSSVERSLTRNEAGRDVPSSDEVRPGFRVAPVVVRRADILRFLDTDALTRGTVFFDYFPHPAQSLGERPDEELKMLEEERFVLRVVRDDRARQLTELYPGAGCDFANSAALEKFVEKLLSEVDLDKFDTPSDALPPEARSVITELRTAQRRLTHIRSRLDKGVQNLNPVAYKSQLSRVVPVLRSIGDDLTASFKRIARADHVTAIKVLVAQTGPVSLDIVVDFDNGTSALPQQIFSEGYKDLIALLFFLAITRKAAEFGQAKVLVLDDALQSVDATIRFRLMAYVLDQFENWQLVITGHDKAWHEQLRMLFTRKGRAFVDRKVAGWSFDGGIGMSDAQSDTDSLRGSLSRHDERQTAAATGILLEEITKELSWRVPISVPRKEGDRYTLGDLWPTLAKVLRTTSIGGVVNDINLEYDLRNAVGAHYSDWANGVPWSDIRNFAEDVLRLHESVFCNGCSDWVRKRGPRFACSCGATSFS
jgi:recombinational DNA repair ATPase RecF